VLFVYYLLARRRVTIGVLSDAGVWEGLRLKANASEREDLADALKVMAAILHAGATTGEEEEQEPEEEGEPRPRREALEAAAPEPSQPAQPPPQTYVLNCPQCSRQIQVLASQRGKRVRCPACQAVFQVG
jgi:predicted Zn finger-like uncharacterized protein